MNSYTEAVKIFLDESRSNIEELRNLEGDWEINDLLDDQMEILRKMQEWLQNQLTPIKDPVKSSYVLRQRSTTTTTIKNHQKGKTKEIVDQPTKKRKREQLTNSEDEDTDEYTDKYKIHEEEGDRILGQLDDLKRKKQLNADLRRQPRD